MPDPRGFLAAPRKDRPYRDPEERKKDFREYMLPMAQQDLKVQATRCMGCAIPFCHSSCPLGNLIPDWNDLVRQERWKEAYLALNQTNSFPELTGKLCPAPCEDACVLALEGQPVTIKTVEMEIIHRAIQEGWVEDTPPAILTGKRVAVVGSGPAGMAAADQLRKAGHEVDVLEQWDRLGGLVRYGVPDYKMDKSLLDWRLERMRAQGVRFQTGVRVGSDVRLEDLASQYDAVALCIGSLKPRDVKSPGRDLAGVHFAMDYLTAQNKACAGGPPVPEELNAAGRKVVILGGGDTGADCYGTALRQGAASVTQFDVNPDPAGTKPAWPNPVIRGRKSPVHDEGGHREWSIQTIGFAGDSGRVTGVKTWEVAVQRGVRMPTRVVDEVYPADMVLLAIGFEGPDFSGLPFGGPRVPVSRSMETDVPGVFAAGDCRRGPSLIVWAIAEGRNLAYEIDRRLMGESRLARSF